ncbi:unnamed protein product [Trichogramma brassicae]|uniref:Uncharacterized protein n=1 Tax=Trichogramma brassicae TaxID=86971 RepID=A0A6H5IAA2_9HYME|nr:unnamed protein product [Trichogramma brassicae]
MFQYVVNVLTLTYFDLANDCKEALTATCKNINQATTALKTEAATTQSAKSSAESTCCRSSQRSNARSISDGAPKRDIVNAVSVSRGRPITIKKSGRITVGPRESEEANRRDAPGVKAELVRSVNPSILGGRVERVHYGRGVTVVIEGEGLCADNFGVCPELAAAGLEVKPSSLLDPRLIVHGMPVELTGDEIGECIKQTSTGLQCVSSCQIYQPIISKHDVLFATFELSVPNYVETAVAHRDFRQLDPRRFNAELGSIDWEHIARLPDVDDMVETLTARLNGLFNAHAPLRTIVQKKYGKPWFGAGLKAIIRERNRAWRSYRRLGRPDELMEFKRMRNHLRFAARNAKAAYYRAKLTGCAPAQAWRILRSLSMSSFTQDSFMLPVDVDTLNEGFVRGGGHVAASALRPTVRVAPEERLYLTDVDACEVVAAFKRARSNARGADGLGLDQL